MSVRPSYAFARTLTIRSTPVSVVSRNGMTGSLLQLKWNDTHLVDFRTFHFD